MSIFEPPDMLRVHSRWMIRRDFPEVLAIEHADARPWDEEEFLRHLRQRNCIGMVAEAGERIVGFAVYTLDADRIALLKLAVDPGRRRRGVGHQLLGKLVGKLHPHRRTRIVADVREGSLGAHLFLRTQGFLATEVIREHFEDTGEDAYAMAYDLDECDGC